MGRVGNIACTTLLAFLLAVSPIETAKSSSIPKPKIAPARTSATIEGSANLPKHLADTEVQGSGYPNDDEDGDDIHASGAPPPPMPTLPPSNTKKNDAVIVASTTTTTIKPVITTGKPIVSPKPIATVDRQKEVIVDEDDDDDDDEDDEFDDEKIDDDVTTITQPPVVYREPETTTRSPTTTRAPKTSTPTDFSGPFSPFHETMTNGIFAAVAGGMLVAVITAILLVLFVVFRIRKKDEGSYALDEPKPRPYVGYAYTKASTKEFYA